MEYISFIYLFLLLYTIISLLLMFFIIYYRRYTNIVQSLIKKNTQKWKKYIETHILINPANLAFVEKDLYKKLRSPKQMMSFLEASESYLQSDNLELRDTYSEFIKSFISTWTKIGYAYSKKSSMHKTYFSHVCSLLPFDKTVDSRELSQLMIQFIDVPSVYCKQNALKALYNFGNADPVIEALILLSDKEMTLNHKLITDGLIKYTGDKVELIEKLYMNLDNFCITYQVAVIDYFRFEGEFVKDRLYSYLEDFQNNKDVVCSTLRFYRKFPVHEYKPHILRWADENQVSDWESVATAVATLAVYPGEDTTNTLLTGLHSRNWYVRRNSAISIKILGINEELLEDIFQGDDPYAKDQLNYYYHMGESNYEH